MTKNPESSRETLSWVVQLVASAVVSLVVAVASSAVTLQQMTKENLRDIARIKLDIIKYAKESDVSSAIAALGVLEGVIDERQLKKLNDQLKKIYTKTIDSDADPASIDLISSEEIIQIAPPPDGSLQDLIKKFEGDDRLAASNALIERYREHPAEVVSALISALDSDSSARYRTNLYVPFTLKRIEGGWKGSVQQRDRIASISETSEDPTTKKRVQQAIANWRPSSP